MKKILISIFTILSFCIAKAQQDAQFTHYMFNTLAVNPGYAGTRDALTITGLHRSQWVGFEGAPITQTLTLHSPVFSNQLGVGLSIVNDKIGPTNMTSFYGDIAYRLKLSEKGSLSLGVKGGVNLRSNELNSLELDESGDASFQKNVSSDILPNVGFGAYYFQDKFYIGISAPKLLENDFTTNKTNGGTNLASEQRHYFLIGGFVTSLSDNVELKPTTFLKVTNGAPLEADFTGTLIFNKKLALGGMFRTGDALGVLLGYNITEQLRIGYSFDWSYVNKTVAYNAGSHELMLRYDFIYKNQGKIKSPRYF